MGPVPSLAALLAERRGRYLRRVKELRRRVAGRAIHWPLTDDPLP